MQLVVPMAGWGQRFRRAGYSEPKPIVPFFDRPLLAWVLGLVPEARRTVLIVADEVWHDPSTGLAEAVGQLAPDAVVAVIPAHRRGPVASLLAARDRILPDVPTIVSMCDLCFDWDPAHAMRWMADAGAAGAVVTYRGFHPHLLRSTHYAHLRERDGWATAIQEKASYTADPIAAREPCSNGVYLFSRGELVTRYAERVAADVDLAIEGEHYVSQLFGPMIDDGLPVGVYDTAHYIQLGHPEDLQAAEGYARRFARKVARDTTVRPGTLLVPMAGLGQRFADRGERLPKPLLDVGGRPMVVQAALDLPRMERTVFVQRKDLPWLTEIQGALDLAVPGCEHLVLDGPTDGQARTVLLGIERARIDLDRPVVVGTCDNGVDLSHDRHAAMLTQADLLVWGVRHHPAARAHPRQFGWIDHDDDGRVRRLSVKEPLRDPAIDPIVIGAFSARRAGDLVAAIERLIAREGRVRGEFYLDSAVQDAIDLGLRVLHFEVDAYHGWGTPDELDTWRYWQGFFHRWPHHPYRLEADPRVPPEAVAALEARIPPLRPPPLRRRDDGDAPG